MNPKDRRFESFPFTRVPFWARIFDPAMFVLGSGTLELLGHYVAD